MKKTLTSYDILNIPMDATQNDIHSAYRKLAMSWHPDRHHPARRADADRHFKMLQEAYNKVKTPADRNAYNQWLKTRTHSVLAQQNKVVNDNTSLKSFLDTLETIFWPIDRSKQDKK